MAIATVVSKYDPHRETAQFHLEKIDHMIFACYDRRFWRKQLERFGFTPLYPAMPASSYAYEVDRYWGTAMTFGGVKILLVDQENSAYRKGLIRDLLLKSGDMHMFSAAVLVDRIWTASREWSKEGLNPHPLGDVEGHPFKVAGGFTLDFPYPSPFFWQFVSKRHDECRSLSNDISWQPVGVDHFAVAVDNLTRWIAEYQAMGFKIIYEPEEIRGEYSGMKTVALRRDGVVVALVEGVDGVQPSQVSTYRRAHGDHSVQHAALLFKDLPLSVREFLRRGVRFRFRKSGFDPFRPDLDCIIHQGCDYSGSLLQAFTKPLARRGPTAEVGPGARKFKGGFFWEVNQRGVSVVQETSGELFYDPTVIGLYRSIELEEMQDDASLLFPESLTEGYRFDEWDATNRNVERKRE